MPSEREQGDEINGELLPEGVSALADAIRAAVGAAPGEPVHMYAPPHRTRGDGRVVNRFPLTMAEFEELRHLPVEKLIDLGLRRWSEETGLLLFPVEWYPMIPPGFMLTSISGETEPFEPGVTDDDCRFGVLAYGIIPVSPPAASEGAKE